MFKKKTPILYVYQALCRTETKNIIPGAYINDPHCGQTVVVQSVVPDAKKDNYYHVTVQPIGGKPVKHVPFTSSTFGAEGDQMWTIYK